MSDSKYGNTNVNGEFLRLPLTEPLDYFADYSMSYTNRSLVDKEYVDGLISGVNFWNFLSPGDLVLAPGITGSVIPLTDDTNDLGSSTNRWKDLYLGSKIDASLDLEIYTNSVKRIHLYSNGKIEIGPGSKVTVNGGSGDNEFFGIRQGTIASALDYRILTVVDSSGNTRFIDVFHDGGGTGSNTYVALGNTYNVPFANVNYGSLQLNSFSASNIYQLFSNKHGASFGHISFINGAGGGMYLDQDGSARYRWYMVGTAGSPTNHLLSSDSTSWLAFSSTQLLGIGMESPTAKFHIRGTGSTSATITQIWEAQDTTTLMTLRDDGRLGINTSPVTGDRVKITAGSGLDGAINISASNVADNGYSILAQGGTASANYNGIWSDVAIEGTGTNMAFRGSTLLSGGNNNYGLRGLARNGTLASIGVFGEASGGDSVDSTDSVGVLGVNASQIALSKKAVWGYLNNNVDNSTGYGIKGEAGNQGTNAINYAVHGLAAGAGATVINTAGFFQASGGSGATNYALVTNGGNIGFGTTTPSAQAMHHIVPGSRAHLLLDPISAATASAITAADGMLVYVNTTNGTFTAVGFWGYENGAWTKL